VLLEDNDREQRGGKKEREGKSKGKCHQDNITSLFLDCMGIPTKFHFFDKYLTI
jgi:hypothetical protein